MKTVTYLATLMLLAKDEARARKMGDPQVMADAIAKHEEYRRLCLEADEMVVGLPVEMLR